MQPQMISLPQSPNRPPTPRLYPFFKSHCKCSVFLPQSTPYPNPYDRPLDLRTISIAQSLQQHPLLPATSSQSSAGLLFLKPRNTSFVVIPVSFPRSFHPRRPLVTTLFPTSCFSSPIDLARILPLITYTSLCDLG